MNQAVVTGFAGVTDPAKRLSIGVRQFIRRAHEEPLLGRFMSRFGLSPAVLQAVLAGQPLEDLRAGVESGRYAIGRAQLPAMVAMLAGGTLAAMLPVLDGQSTWRDVGSDTAELMLVAFGLGRDEARSLARSPLPPLGTTPER
jgi:hypothetical protein